MLRIRTKAGHYYDITPDGNIIRLDQKDFKPSGQWRLTGIETTYGFHEFIPFNKINEWLQIKPKFLFKNGNPRYTVRDFDHGTTRTWGDGISDVWMIKD